MWPLWAQHLQNEGGCLTGATLSHGIWLWMIISLGGRSLRLGSNGRGWLHEQPGFKNSIPWEGFGLSGVVHGEQPSVGVHTSEWEGRGPLASDRDRSLTVVSAYGQSSWVFLKNTLTGSTTVAPGAACLGRMASLIWIVLISVFSITSTAQYSSRRVSISGTQSKVLMTNYVVFWGDLRLCVLVEKGTELLSNHHLERSWICWCVMRQ